MKNYWEMTELELVDFIQKAINDQGGPSIGNNGCAYRSPNGRKCAAGHLLPDEVYDRDMEEATWPRVTSDYHLDRTHRTLITRLQFIHDSSTGFVGPERDKLFLEKFNKDIESLRNELLRQLSEFHAPSEV
jgi:hypothetical protein